MFKLFPRRYQPKVLGVLGETFATWFYRLRGYSIVARNVRVGSGEIDLVARRGRTLVIAEVKTRQTKSAGEGHEAVGRVKREQLIGAADRFAANLRDVVIRYDVVSLFWTGHRFAIAHYPDAFQPMSDASRPWRWRA